MGTYIHTSVEVRKDAGWAANEDAVFTADPTWPGMEGEKLTIRPFFNQNYALFALLTGRRDVPGITPIGISRGLPTDTTEDSLQKLAGNYEYTRWDDPDAVLTVDERVRGRINLDRVGFSWIGVDELLAIDYGIQVIDPCEPGSLITLGEALGSLYLKHLSQIKSLGNPVNTRVLFCFDD